MAGALAIAMLGSGASAQERPWTPLPSPPSATCPGGLCQAQSLTPFFEAMDGRRVGAGSPTVRIVQFGDSHTAGHLITDALRERLQTRFPRQVVSLEAIGVVGVTLNDLAARDLSFEGGSPDLIVIAYGTNEGFDDTLDAAAYERLLVAQIRRLRQAAPGAALLILGAPEAMRGGEDGTCAGDPDRRWAAPPMLGVVRDIQYRTAARMGVAFWDWYGRMGGRCSAHRLTQGEEPLMWADHVHFTQVGADWIGRLLYDDLQTAGRAWYRGIDYAAAQNQRSARER